MTLSWECILTDQRLQTAVLGDLLRRFAEQHWNEWC